MMITNFRPVFSQEADRDAAAGVPQLLVGTAEKQPRTAEYPDRYLAAPPLRFL